MAYQSLANIVVAYKVQSALGTPATGASGKALRVVDGTADVLRALVVSNTSRSDGQTNRSRLGSRRVNLTINSELTVAEFDEVFRALFRGAEVASAVRTYDNSAGLTSLQVTSTSEITQVGTTTLLGVVDRGDLIKLGSMSTAANNDVWVRVKNVSATVINLYGTPLTVQAADIACTLTVAKKLSMGDPPTERYFTFDIYNADIDRTLQLTDVKVSSAAFRKAPNSPILVSLGLMGLDGQPLATGASPSLTSPTEYTGRPLVPADGTIAVGGSDYTDLTAFDLSIDCGGQVPETLSANPPDVFLGGARVRGSFSTLVTDFDHFDAMDAETQQEILLHMVEPETNPKDGIALYAGDAILTTHPLPFGGTGPQIVSVGFEAGKDEGGSDRAATMVKLASTSAAL